MHTSGTQKEHTKYTKAQVVLGKRNKDEKKVYKAEEATNEGRKGGVNETGVGGMKKGRSSGSDVGPRKKNN